MILAKTWVGSGRISASVLAPPPLHLTRSFSRPVFTAKVARHWVGRRLGGETTGKSASFRSCVRCEAVCGREEERIPSLGFHVAQTAPGERSEIFPREVFADRCWGFKGLECFLLTGAGVLRDWSVFC